jgi:hypothetical protein
MRIPTKPTLFASAPADTSGSLRDWLNSSVWGRFSKRRLGTLLNSKVWYGSNSRARRYELPARGEQPRIFRTCIVRKPSQPFIGSSLRCTHLTLKFRHGPGEIFVAVSYSVISRSFPQCHRLVCHGEVVTRFSHKPSTWYLNRLQRFPPIHRRSRSNVFLRSFAIQIGSPRASARLRVPYRGAGDAVILMIGGPKVR